MCSDVKLAKDKSFEEHGDYLIGLMNVNVMCLSLLTTGNWKNPNSHKMNESWKQL